MAATGPEGTRNGPLARVRRRLASRAARWSRRRTGAAASSVTLERRRIYILPTGLGLVYALMLFTMLLAGLNYGNNLALVLTFVLTSLGWVAMHECHRNLAGLTIAAEKVTPAHAGEAAQFAYRLSGDPDRARYDFVLSARGARAGAVSVPANGAATARLPIPTTRRGWLVLESVAIESRYPLGLCRTWSWLHFDQSCPVYPALGPARPALPPGGSGTSAQAAASATGDEDWSALRRYRVGDSLARVAWKAYARGGELLVHEFSGTSGVPVVFDLDTIEAGDLEARLSILARLVTQAAAGGACFGLKLGSLVIEPDRGHAQRDACLGALAGYGLPPPALAT